MKKLFALVLTLAITMCLCLPVMAAENDHSITITETDPGHIFEAYQIFSGNVVNIDGDKILSDVEWGAGIKADAKVNWGTAEAPNELTLIEALANQSINPSYYHLYAQAATAEDIVVILSSAPHNTTAHAMEFATIVGKYLADQPTSSADAVTEGVGYVIENLADGYYLVKEQDGNDTSPATHTSYILQLVEDVTVNVKAGDVTVDKTILDGSTPTNVSDYSIGDNVQFQITGTLPANYNRFTEYEYIFHDTMSPGLTLNYIDHDNDPETPDVPDLKVEFDNDASVITVDPAMYELIIDEDLNENGLPTQDTLIDIKFADLVAVGEDVRYTVNRDTKIVVTYNATLNENAIIGGDGNPNEVYLEFDNDPYNEGKGETPEDIVYVFTFELDVGKINGKTKENLAGVEFKLFRRHGGQPQYVIINDDGVVVGYTENVDEGSVLVTNAEGKFDVKGLEASVYTLTETKPLPGYDSIADIRFTISAKYDLVELKLTDLKVTVDGETETQGDIESGVVALTVINNPGNTLPATGGFGTTLFFVFGGILFAGAVILLVTKRRMAAEF